ncbi:diguanylate cyclase [Acinetobacter baumannii]|uniref:diguanylate cyclase domain-containing protein n=1 Tax=Acinetobacter TaxID=469 RepID=UPI000918011E|nr:diguanylate cyclase [Acinetobacter baumannii]EJB8411632.1 diguanylate cyclase [Acinetobacter baumannii]MBF9227473.1 diguanylate cyclase [Acinetobacter baumannii]MCG6633440.1 diguanylate cyclase [Acinetobacter baumannii]MCZ3074942.1 diguanylate cyclase [Acinetobacter baumannii]MCZ3344540.1 diguanylate cyclase [Acinetobacter baumannii]
MNLLETQKMFGKIYFSTQNYGKSPETIFLHLVKNVGSSTRTTFRNYDIEGSKKTIAKILAWYFALCNRYNFEVDNIIWSKYPSICPRCLDEKCQCDQENLNDVDEDKLRAIVFENRFSMPKSINEWQLMFARIYPPKLDRDNLAGLQVKDIIASIYARIFEELAEVAECIALDSYCDPLKKEYLANELADVFAWINSLCNTLNYYYNTDEFNLQSIVSENYPDVCNKCSEPRCVCAKGDFALELSQKGIVGISHYDKLTKLANNSALQIILNKHLANEEKFYVFFIDIDNFGIFNKSYGQDVGDSVLSLVAHELSNSFNKHQIKGGVFRKGGEEFVVVSNTNNEEFAYYLAEDLRRAVESIDIKGIEEKVTISIGVAYCENGHGDEAIKTADTHMRDAKSSGKNTIRPEIDDLPRILEKYALKKIYA